MMMRACLLTLCVLCVAAAGAETTTPALVWCSAAPSEAKTVEDPLADVLSAADALCGSAPPRLRLVFAEAQLSARALAARSADFAAALPSARFEAPFTAGVDFSALPPPADAASPAAAVSAAAAAAAESTTVLFRVDAASAADVVRAADAAARGAGVPFVAVYTAEAAAEPAKAAAAVKADAGTTVFSGPVMMFLFTALLMLCILWFALSLLFSMQSQSEADAPKQKQI